MIRTTLVTGLLVLAGAFAFAQQPIRYTLTNDMADYTTVHVIEVPDRPGHILRIFELVWDQTENDDPTIFDGVRVERIVQQGFADYAHSTGSLAGYEAYHLENGDVIYGRYTGTTQTTIDEDGNVAGTAFMGVHEITGGTGAFEGIGGLLRSTLSGEPGPDDTFVWSDTVVEGSYWMRDAPMGSAR